jgi:hypothetical protein
MARKLVERGADVNTMDIDGLTAFHLLIDRPCQPWEEYNECVALFLEHGANSVTPTRDGRLPFAVFLQRAASQGKISASPEKSYWLQFLESGRDPMHVSAEGRTLFHLAEQVGWDLRWKSTLVTMLLRAVSYLRRITGGTHVGLCGLPTGVMQFDAIPGMMPRDAFNIWVPAFRILCPLGFWTVPKVLWLNTSFTPPQKRL